MRLLMRSSASECIYALPRGDKAITGPSIRFAEILLSAFGNCRCTTRVSQVDRIEMFVEAEATFHDLETNAATKATVRRRISDKYGRVLSNDMIIVTGNAACSIAKRNAILAGVPKPLWRQAFAMVRQTIAGDVKTLVSRRDVAIKAFAYYGVKPAQIFGALNVSGEEDITVDTLVTLHGMFSALKNGELTVEEMFASARGAAAIGGSNHAKVANPLADPEPGNAGGKAGGKVETKPKEKPSDESKGERVDKAAAGEESLSMLLADLRKCTALDQVGDIADSWSDSKPTEFFGKDIAERGDALLTYFDLVVERLGGDDAIPADEIDQQVAAIMGKPATEAEGKPAKSASKK